MRDQPLTTEQAARWLECSADEVQSLIAAGRIRAFGVGEGDAADTVSLNSVVVFAESLPVERGVFRVRETPFSGDSGYSPKPPAPGGRPTGDRGGFVVERRTPGRRL